MTHDKEIDIFFRLLKYSLHLGDELVPHYDGSVGGSDALWLRSMAKDQGVSAIMFDAVCSYMGEAMPDELALPWLSLKKKVEQWGLKQREAAAALSSILRESGVRMMLVKGLSTSLLYPEPLLREYGDIDIYCFDDYEKVNAMATAAGAAIEEEDDKHALFHFRGIPVENHRTLNYEHLNRSNTVVAKYMLKIVEDRPLAEEALGGVLVPSPNGRALHMMMHTLTHLAWSGIPARNLADWTLLTKKFGSEIDWNLLRDIWSEASTLRAVSIINRICVEHMGMEPSWLSSGLVEDMAALSSDDVDFVLSAIMNPCRSSADTPMALRKIWRRFRRYFVRKRMHRIVYDEAFPDGIIKGVTGRSLKEMVLGRGRKGGDAGDIG